MENYMENLKKELENLGISATIVPDGKMIADLNDLRLTIDVKGMLEAMPSLSEIKTAMFTKRRLDELKREEITENDLKDLLTNISFVSENIRTIFASEERFKDGYETLSTPYKGIVELLVLYDEEGDRVIPLRKDLLKDCPIANSSLWQIAQEKISKGVITHISKLISSALNMDEDEDVPMFVLTNEERNFGANVLLDESLLETIARKYNTTKVLVFPSSIHEVIAIPFLEEFSEKLNEYPEMVRDINKTQLKPTEVLSDNAYLVDLENGLVETLKS